MKTIYRYEIEYKTIDDDTAISLIEYKVLRETEHTYFIKLPTYARFSGRLKQVKKKAYNTFAYSTKEEAKKHFISRTETRIAWFEFCMEECKKGLELIKQK